MKKRFAGCTKNAFPCALQPKRLFALKAIRVQHQRRLLFVRGQIPPAFLAPGGVYQNAPHRAVVKAQRHIPDRIHHHRADDEAVFNACQHVVQLHNAVIKPVRAQLVTAVVIRNDILLQPLLAPQIPHGFRRLKIVTSRQGNPPILHQTIVALQVQGLFLLHLGRQRARRKRQAKQIRRAGEVDEGAADQIIELLLGKKHVRVVHISPFQFSTGDLLSAKSVQHRLRHAALLAVRRVANRQGTQCLHLLRHGHP